MGLDGLGEWIKSTINESADYLKAWIRVSEFEEGYILRWGKFHKILKPGWHWKIPIADYPYVDNVMPDTMSIPPVTLTTQDGKTVSIGMVIHYQISDFKKFALENNDSRTNMKDLAAAILSDHLEEVTWENIKKKTTKNAVQRKMTPCFTDMGVEILGLEFKDKVEVQAYKFFNEGKEGINAI